MAHLLAAIDLSVVTDDVLRESESLARALRAELTLVHVAAPEPEFVGYEIGPQDVRNARAVELRAEHRDIQTWAAELTARGVKTQALLVEGPTVEKILKEADKIGATMMILGSHGHGALYEAIIGGTTSGVIRSATCPVVVVPDSRRHK